MDSTRKEKALPPQGFRTPRGRRGDVMVPGISPSSSSEGLKALKDDDIGKNRDNDKEEHLNKDEMYKRKEGGWTDEELKRMLHAKKEEVKEERDRLWKECEEGTERLNDLEGELWKALCEVKKCLEERSEREKVREVGRLLKEYMGVEGNMATINWKRMNLLDWRLEFWREKNEELVKEIEEEKTRKRKVEEELKELKEEKGRRRKEVEDMEESIREEIMETRKYVETCVESLRKELKGIKGKDEKGVTRKLQRETKEV